MSLLKPSYVTSRVSSEIKSQKDVPDPLELLKAGRSLWRDENTFPTNGAKWIVWQIASRLQMICCLGLRGNFKVSNSELTLSFEWNCHDLVLMKCWVIKAHFPLLGLVTISILSDLLIVFSDIPLLY